MISNAIQKHPHHHHHHHHHSQANNNSLMNQNNHQPINSNQIGSNVNTGTIVDRIMTGSNGLCNSPGNSVPAVGVGATSNNPMNHHIHSHNHPHHHPSISLQQQGGIGNNVNNSSPFLYHPNRGHPNFNPTKPVVAIQQRLVTMSCYLFVCFCLRFKLFSHHFRK